MRITEDPKAPKWLNAKRRYRQLILYFGEQILWQFEKLISRYSLMGDSSFFDPYQLRGVSVLEAQWKSIRQELDYVLQYPEELPNFQDISPDQADRISRDNLWKTYFLYGDGVKIENNCQRCPETTRLIEKIPGMKTAFFSILLPGKHIPEHRGPYKGVIRYLLGLKVPESKKLCRIRVGEQSRYWQEGKSMMFDDSFPHEVWNETSGIRGVLFLDIVRPLPWPLSLINQLLIQLIAKSPFVQDATANQKKWDRRLDELFARKLPQKV